MNVFFHGKDPNEIYSNGLSSLNQIVIFIELRIIDIGHCILIIIEFIDNSKLLGDNFEAIDRTLIKLLEISEDERFFQSLKTICVSETEKVLKNIFGQNLQLSNSDNDVRNKVLIGKEIK